MEINIEEDEIVNNWIIEQQKNIKIIEKINKIIDRNEC